MQRAAWASKMSRNDIKEGEDIVAQARKMCCASCGKSELDDIKLKKCDGCDLVRYCSDNCQQDHRPQHAGKCKERAAELREETLFRQPESSHLGDCPICSVPLPIEDPTFYSCCCKNVCIGCSNANQLHQLEENMPRTCPFCRHPLPIRPEYGDKYMSTLKRVATDNPVALCKLGMELYHKGDYDGAFKYWKKAAALGDADAHFNLSIIYHTGDGVEKDENKNSFHLEEAAIRGHPEARHALALKEGAKGNFERTVKHFIIAANLGHDNSIQTLRKHYKDGLVSKDDLAAALRGHHAAVEATKSPNREMVKLLLGNANASKENKEK